MKSKQQEEAIIIFFNSLEQLKELKVVRSDVIFGDIGEFLCTVVFENLSLVEEKTKEGYDALIDGQETVQVNIHRLCRWIFTCRIAYGQVLTMAVTIKSLWVKILVKSNIPSN